MQQAKLAKECTFTPSLNKPKIPGSKKAGEVIPNRTSTSSIDLTGFAKRNNNPGIPSEAPTTAKYNQLYNLAKKQIDKTDKRREDYEFERAGDECTFAPQLISKPYGAQAKTQNTFGPRSETP